MNRQEATRRFEELVWPHAATVLRSARLLLRDQAEAEDVAQETLVKAFNAIGSFRDGTDVRAWLMTILRHTRIDHFRASGSHPKELSLADLPYDPAGPDYAADQTAEAAWDDPERLLAAFGDAHVIDALQRLPEEIRWTLLLVDVEGLDHRDAAPILGVPVGTVKSRAHRGRRMLRDALAPVARELRLIP